MTSIRDRIFALDDLTRETVTIPEWDNVEIEMRSPSAGQRTLAIRDCMEDDGGIDTLKMQGMLIVSSAHDPETGEPVFAPSDIGLLNEKNAAIVQRLFEVAQRLSGMGAEEGDPESPLDS